jgi:hypothetical protein
VVEGLSERYDHPFAPSTVARRCYWRFRHPFSGEATLFRSETLFVLGAGASAEFDFPTGVSLMNDIKDKLTVDWSKQQVADGDIHRALMVRVQQTRPDSPHQCDLRDYLEAAEQISLSMPLSTSIDTYIADQGDPCVELCGKLAIVKAILAAEDNSAIKLRSRHGQTFRVDFDKLANKWLIPFFKRLRQQQQNLDTIFDNVAIISFNYDRSFEFFLMEALRTYYNLTEEDAEKTLLTLRIVHPYGTVGPWREGTDHLRFGDVVGDPERLLHLAKRIRTYTEISQPPEHVKTLVSKAQTIIFLGFGYIEENLKLLGPSEGGRLTEKIYGTAYGISEPSRAILSWRLGSFLGPAPGPGVGVGQPRIALFDGKCAQLFDEHWFGISLGL